MDFDMLFEEGGTSQTAPSSHSHSHPQTHMALRLLRRLCTTEDEKLRKVLELVRESLLVLNAEELQQRHLVVQTAKKALELAGYTTRVVTSGRKGQLCFRHTYLQLVGQGVNEDEPKPFIVVEPLLREELQIVRPTEQYQRLLDTVPQVFVGTLSRLSALIEFVTARMEESFREQGMCTPPWRQVCTNNRSDVFLCFRFQCFCFMYGTFCGDPHTLYFVLLTHLDCCYHHRSAACWPNGTSPAALASRKRI